MIYKSIFIDLDDTLWDTYHNNKECLEEIYTDHHFDRYYASFEAFFRDLLATQQPAMGTVPQQ